MTRFQLCAFAGLSVLAACVVKNSASNDPSAGEYNDYYSEKGGATDGSGGGTTDGTKGPKPQTVTSTTGAPTRKGKTIAAKKKPVDGTKPRKPRPKPEGPQALTMEGFVPTNVGAGSVVEVFGTGWENQKEVYVTVGKKRQKILEAAQGHLIFQVADGAKGNIAIAAITRGGKGRPVGATVAKSETPLVQLGKTNPFAKGRTDPAHGLIGNVFSIGKEVKELPKFDDLGAPIATIGVDNLDIPNGKFEGSFKGKGGEAKEWFAIHFKGSLNITAAGEYELCLNAGDGAQLYLDENLIVNNDGSHDTTEKCEKLNVEPGEYKLDLLYFQGTGDMGLQLMWSKDGAEKAAIPKDAFFPPEDMNTMAVK